MKKIGIKVGSAALINESGDLDVPKVMDVCRQISILVNSGMQVFLVTSGAVASDPRSDRLENFRAAVGQARLISNYVRFFEIFGIETAQILLTDRDFMDEASKDLTVLLESAIQQGVVPVINANDVVDWAELKALDLCADNDNLFFKVCSMLKPDMAITLFDQPGVMDRSGVRMPLINTFNWDSAMECIDGGSMLGHGEFGMRTKMENLRKLTEQGIKTFLCSADEDDPILRSVKELMRDDPFALFGTRFKFPDS